MHLTIINAMQKKLVLNHSLKRIAAILEKEIGKTNGIINVIFCDQKTSKMLNRSYRKKNTATNVLTFNYLLTGKTPQDLLAEIYLNIPYIKTEAIRYDEAFSHRLITLFIHGLLHAKGYDHEKDQDYRIMKLLEEKILKRYLRSKKN